MATHDYVIDNSTGANVRADINLVLQAILTNNSSSSAPSTTAAYMWWADTTNGVLKIRNSSNNDWVELLQLDGTLTLEDGSASTPGLAFRDDLNTGIFSSAADTFNVATGGVERMELGATTIFNEDGADVDFRIEGDTDVNLFYADAGNNRIGLGISSPTSKLYVNTVSTEHVITAAVSDTNGNSIINILAAGTTGNSRILFSDTAANDGIISYSHNDRALVFGTAGTAEDMRLDSSGRLLIGSSSHVDNGGIEAHLQVLGTGTDDTSIILSRYSNDGSSPFLVFSKSRNGSIGGNTVLQSGDRIGRIKFFGNDGTDGSTPAAEIDVEVDGTPGSNDMPGRIVFSTTADGAASPTERMRINSSGNVLVGTTSDLGRLTVSKAQNDLSSAGGFANPHIRLDAPTTTNITGFTGIAYSVSSLSNYGWTAGAQRVSGGGTDGAFIFRHHSNSATGNERMRIDSSGNLAIGTTSAAQKLHIDGSSNDPFVMLQRSGAGDSAVDIGGIQMKNSTNILADIRCRSDDINDGMLKFSTMSAGTLQECMRIQSDGDVSFSNSNSGSAQIKNVNGDQSSVNAGGFPQYAFNGNEGTGMRRPSANNLALDTTGDERMRINSSGNILMGTTSVLNTGTLTIKGNGVVPLTTEASATSAFSQILFNNPNGIVGEIRSSGSSTSYLTSSDYRLKENIETLSDGITRLKTLKPYRFNWKTVSGKPKEDGFLAHEVTAVPEAISGTKDEVDENNKPIYQGIDQSKLVPLLVAAVQELITKVETLEAA